MRTPLGVLLVAANAIGGLYILASIRVCGRTAATSSTRQLRGPHPLANLLFFRSALAQPGRWRRPWLLVSAGLVAVLLGSLTSAVYQASSSAVFPLLRGPTSSSWRSTRSSSPDCCSSRGAVTTRAEAFGFALDAVAVLFGSGMLVAYRLIIPTFERGKGGLAVLIVSAALPLGDVLLVFGLVSLVVRRRSLPRDASMAALAAALLLLLASDLLYSYQAHQRRQLNDTLQSCMGALSWILVAWAGYEQVTQQGGGGPAARDRRPQPVRLPSGLRRGHRRLRWSSCSPRRASSTLRWVMMILAAVAVTPLLLARQVLALRESGTLHELKGSHETEERFRSLVTNSSDTIFVTDDETSILYAHAVGATASSATLADELDRTQAQRPGAPRRPQPPCCRWSHTARAGRAAARAVSGA